MPSQGLRALSHLGVDHRDVSIGNVLLGTDPEKAPGFISDLDLSSISEEAIKAAYPNDHDEIIEQLKDGEWRMVSEYHSSDLDYLLTQFMCTGDSTLHGRWAFDCLNESGTPQRQFKFYLPTQALPRLRILNLGRSLCHDDSP